MRERRMTHRAGKTTGPGVCPGTTNMTIRIPPLICIIDDLYHGRVAMGGAKRRVMLCYSDWLKVMAVYRRVYGFGHLQADRPGPGSASEPYAFIDGATFTF